MTTWLDDSLDGAIDNLRIAEETLEQLDHKNYVTNAYIALVLMDSAIDAIRNTKISHMGGETNEN